MREKLNENPSPRSPSSASSSWSAAFFFISSGGAKKKKRRRPKRPSPSPAPVSTATATGATPGEAVEGAVESLEAGAANRVGAVRGADLDSARLRPRDRLLAAYDSGKTVVLLIVDRGGIDDRLVTVASSLLAEVPDTATFVVPAGQIARYAAITVGLDVNRVPALVVMRPKRLSGGTPQASVDFRLPDSPEHRAGGPRRLLRGAGSHLPPGLRWTDEQRAPAVPEPPAASSRFG